MEVNNQMSSAVKQFGFAIKQSGRQISLVGLETPIGAVVETRMFPSEQIAVMAMQALLTLAKQHLELANVLAMAQEKPVESNVTERPARPSIELFKEGAKPREKKEGAQ